MNNEKNLEEANEELKMAIQLMANQRNNANDEIVRLNIIIAKLNNQIEQSKNP